MAAFTLLIADKCIVFGGRTLNLRILWLAILNGSNADKDEYYDKNSGAEFFKQWTGY